jgi:DNA-binding LytR/AlgR family response regulator
MKALIIEDESLIAEELRHTLNAVAPDIQVLDVSGLKAQENGLCKMLNRIFC